MAENYAESNVVGMQWKRAKEVRIFNPYGGQGMVSIQEEELTQLGDKIITQHSDGLSVLFDPQGSFPEIDPTTGEPTGGMVTHMQLYVALHSLYIHLAKQRDEAVEEVIPPVQP